MALRASRAADAAALAALVLASVAFRLPALVNASTVDSDAAIVGLQARHILHGEWSLFLHGSGYQTSADSCVAALFFLVLGATPFALMLSTFAGHVLATCLAFLTLARHLPRASALVAASPLVLTSAPLHTYILNPPRQASLTLAFVAVFVLDGASARASLRRRASQLAAGAAVASLACFADPYALLLLPALLLFAALAAFDGLAPGASGASRPFPGLAAASLGALVGLVPFVLLLADPRSVHGEATLTLAVIRHNAALLFDPCLPWVLGAAAYAPRDLLGYVPVDPGAAVRLVQRAGAALLLAAIGAGGAAFAFARARVAWPLRRLGALGFAVGALTLGSFLVSVMVMDLFSSRYLAALVLFSPFALAPLADRLGWRGLLAWLAPFLVGAGLSGWLGYGDAVSGWAPVLLPGHGARDELELVAALRARGVLVAIADYWVSYRVTFLDGEGLPVVPIHAREDRYAPYRDAYRRAGRSAYVFDPKRSREALAAMEKEAFDPSSPGRWGDPVDRLEVGGLTAIVFDKAVDSRP